MARNNSLTVCYVVSYRDPNYIRTRNLRAALKRSRKYDFIDATNSSKNWIRYFETIGKTIIARMRHSPDVYVLGFRGHEIFWIIRLIAIGKPLVFDEFMSPSDALMSEKKLGALGQLLGYLAYPMEWLCLRFSRHCITDTALHKRFIAERFSVAAEKIDVVTVGAIAEVQHSRSPQDIAPVDNKATMRVLFYGTFLPLHGIDVLLRACKLVAEMPIEFHIIGGRGKALTKFKELLQELKLDNVRHDDWVDFDDLKEFYIPRADLCIGGPFGGTPQAKRVITGKTFQFLAQSKATVVGIVDELAGFVDHENCLLVEQSNPEQLAQVFEWALDNREALPEIGRKAHELYEQRFSIQQITEQLEQSLRNAL